MQDVLWIAVTIVFFFDIDCIRSFLRSHEVRESRGHTDSHHAHYHRQRRTFRFRALPVNDVYPNP
jgi:hypothetical protein